VPVERRRHERRRSERPFGLELRVALYVVLAFQIVAWGLVFGEAQTGTGEGDPIFPVALGLALASLVFLALITLHTARRQRRVSEAAERRLEAVIERVPALVWTTDRELRITSVTGALSHEQVREGVGVAPDAMKDLPDLIVSSGDDSSPIAEGYAAALRGETSMRSGTVQGIGYEAYIGPLYGDGGSIDGTISIALDVSERLAAAAEIREHERTLARLLANLPDAVVRLDSEGRHIFANPACQNVIGVPPDELIGRNVLELPVPARARKKWAGRVAKVLTTGKTLDFEDAFGSKSDPIYHEIRMVPEYDEQGEVASCLVVVRDSTERRRAERSLRESEERFRVTFEEAPIAMFLVDDDLRIQTCNAAACSLLGYTRDELVGTLVDDVTHPDDVELTREVYARVVEGERKVATEKRYLRKDGEIVWGRLSVSAMPDSEHEATAYHIAQVVDITSLKLAERVLHEREELQRLVIERANDLIAIVGLDFVIRLLSSSVREILGYEPDELIGHSVEELLDPEMVGELQTAMRELVAGRPPRSRAFRLRHRSGDWRLFDGVGSIARNEEGEPEYVVVVLRDVTDRDLLQRQLTIAQKMEAVGQLAGGIAHDFNNLLTVINGFTDVAIASLGKGQNEIRRYLTEIGRAGKRAAELTQHLLAFSRQQVLRPEVVNVNSIVEEYAEMLGSMLGEEIELVTKLEPDLHATEVDPGQLGQVLTNLAVNARDAMTGQGIVTIATENVELKRSIPVAHGALPRGSYVVLTVADTGEGMSAKTREHLFEPFFTTKDPGQGTGLGLATVLGVVEQSGGAIAVESEPGEGATFRVYLPRTRAPVSTRRAQGERIRTGAGTILVVEDDDSVRKLVAKMLGEAGYRVLVTASPRGAITLARREPSIDVLVTDVVMPKMNGHELARRLLDLRPDLSVLYVSGYTPDVVRAKGVLTGKETFLQKPFTAAGLTGAVHDLIVAKSAGPTR
jgi:two-component system cell cycle sensor histidine kinase/response regulator CckA